MHRHSLANENIAWPSYVDFLASFAFVLILFVTWSVSLTAGAEHEAYVNQKLGQLQDTLRAGGFESVIEGEKLRISLKGKVVFGIDSSTLTDDSKRSLAEAGRRIAATSGVGRVVVMGYSDGLKAKHDEFRNWHLSVERAEVVLRYLYLCSDCGYRQEDVRPKLVLHGDGDLSARRLGTEEVNRGERNDRRVDIVLELTDERQS